MISEYLFGVSVVFIGGIAVLGAVGTVVEKIKEDVTKKK